MTHADTPLPLDPWSNALEGRRILVTGSSGYIASRLIPAFEAAGAQFVRLLRPESDSNRTGHDVVRGDPSEPATWQEALEAGVETVIHLAGRSSAQKAAQDPVADWHTNVVPFVRLLEACAAREEAPTVLFAGTATVVGMTPPEPVDESFPENPVTVYDLHKLTNERYLRQYVRQGTVRGATLRLANVYGPGPSSSTNDRGILGLMVRRALEGKPLTVYGDGTFLRDYVYVDDVVRAFAAVATTPQATSKGDAYIVATGQGTALKDAFQSVASAVERETGQTTSVVHVAPPTPLDPIDTRDFIANPNRLTARTGWEPVVSFPDGVTRTVRAARAQRDAEVTAA